MGGHRRWGSKDGLVDGVLEDPRQCAFDPAVLACKAGQGTDACLTPAQVEAMLFAQGECQGCANWAAAASAIKPCAALVG